MIVTILLTAASAAATALLLTHRTRHYVRALEQETDLLRAELVVTQDTVRGLLASNGMYRARLKLWEVIKDVA